MWSFTIIDTPARPVLSSPPNGELTCDATPAFDWSDVAMAASYNIQVDDNANFSSPVVNANPTVSSHTVGTPLALGTYYWQVRAVNDVRWQRLHSLLDPDRNHHAIGPQPELAERRGDHL